MWDPATYLSFAAERTRPARDLLAAVDVADPAYVVDLGAGTGTSTALLAARWPGAEILGLDSSAEMIAAAPRSSRMRFEVGDVREWRPSRRVDVIFSNALLHWVPDHLDLLEGWLDDLAGGGRLAVSVPANAGAPSHTLLREVCGEPRWRGSLGRFAAPPTGLPGPGEYLARLARGGRRPDVWETTYLHLLDGEDPVLRWMSGTALRPVLAALAGDPAERADFLADYGGRLRRAYPPGAAGTVLAFRRVFLVVGNP